MPRKPKMGDRMDALETQMVDVETQMVDVKATLQTLAQQMQQQSAVLSDLCKQVGQKNTNQESGGPMGESSHEESRLSGKKVKLPLFEGDDPVAWITRAEIYFDVQNTTDEMRVKLSRLSMEGSTIHWFNLLMETEDNLSWEKLKKGLITRYGGRRLKNPFEELSTLKHRGSVEEFVEAFELLSSQVGRLPEEQYLGYFMSGLKPQICRRVRTFNPLNRMQMMRIAKDVEEKLRENDDDAGRYGSKKGGQDRWDRSDWAGPTFRNRNGSNMKETSHSNWANPTQKTGSSGSNTLSTTSLASTRKKGENESRPEKGKGIRSIRNDEMDERRAKGLCFKCGGKYHPTLHKCPERSLRVLILGEGETLNDEGEIVSMEEVKTDEEEGEEVECQSMGVLGSMSGNRTMKIEGKFENVDVLVLIDSGASHNFISPQVTNALGVRNHS